MINPYSHSFCISFGYIGIQNHDIDSHVSFKNIRIKEKNE
jgi:hypothetical protein